MSLPCPLNSVGHQIWSAIGTRSPTATFGPLSPGRRPTPCEIGTPAHAVGHRSAELDAEADVVGDRYSEAFGRLGSERCH
jgi:hypothetical protein